MTNEKVQTGKRDKNHYEEEEEDELERPTRKKRRKGLAFVGYYKGRAEQQGETPEQQGETHGMVLDEIRISRWRGYLKKWLIVKSKKGRRGKTTSISVDGTRRTTLSCSQTGNLGRTDIKTTRLQQEILCQNRLVARWNGRSLCQPDCQEDKDQVMIREIEGGKCELDKTISGIRLRAIEANDSASMQRE
jgi:hypothetical protein